jgi:SAM-dependent methyltransferase
MVRAATTNQLARVAPVAYLRLTQQTGRGAAAEESPQDITRYFLSCVDDYFERLGVPREEQRNYLAGKVLLEYGPGDLPGVAATMIARGAEKVWCVDRFPLVNLSAKNAGVIADLARALPEIESARLLSCLVDPSDPGRGFDPSRIEYRVAADGLSGLRSTVDLVYSRAVLEHVNDLDATFNDMLAAMRPGAAAIHLVDLRSHGLHRTSPLDFLTWSESAWRLMYSEKGVPNRWRLDRYRSLLERLPVDVSMLDITRLADAQEIAAVRKRLPSVFRNVSDEDLACLGFWTVFHKRAA